jgi:hypothetical protein
VVQEPEGGVGHDVVSHAVLVAIDGEKSDAVALGLLDAPRRRLPVAVGDGRRDPQGVGLASQGTEAGHEPTGAAPRVELSVGPDRERQGPTVGDDDNRRGLVGDATR